MLQLVPGDLDQNGLLRPPGRSTHVAVPVGVAHSDGPFLQEWAVASRRMHGPTEDLLDWGGCGFLSSFRQNATLGTTRLRANGLTGGSTSGARADIDLVSHFRNSS